jgi:SmpA / OmlA family
MRILASGIIVTLLLVGAIGCATNEITSGKPIPQNLVDEIVDGQTTVTQVISMFGAPTQQSEMGGNTLYVYRYSKTKSSAAFMPYLTSGKTDEQADELTITFDRDSGTVKAHSIQRGVNS